MEKFVIHKAKTRGFANHGWLKSYHSFSFSSYHNPERMNFGALRVLNDDTVDGGMGFGKHPHENMEIISIPLEGVLEHKDSMNNVAIIIPGDIQILSAGTGISHSEHNKNAGEPVKFLQIWVFPDKQNISPRYDQISLNINDRINKLQQIVSPNEDDDGVRIQQNAWFFLGKFNKDLKLDYNLKANGNGVYFFILNGQFEIQGHQLDNRDGIGIWETESISVISKSAESEILVMEVPMVI